VLKVYSVSTPPIHNRGARKSAECILNPTPPWETNLDFGTTVEKGPALVRCAFCVCLLVHGLGLGLGVGLVLDVVLSLVRVDDREELRVVADVQLAQVPRVPERHRVGVPVDARHAVLSRDDDCVLLDLALAHALHGHDRSRVQGALVLVRLLRGECGETLRESRRLVCDLLRVGLLLLVLCLRDRLSRVLERLVRGTRRDHLRLGLRRHRRALVGGGRHSEVVKSVEEGWRVC